MPHINSLVMYLDVPSADLVDPGAFILSSIWSVLEIESISQLTVVLPQHSHLDELKAALSPRFGADRQERGLVTTNGLILSFEDIKKLNKAAFARSLRADIGFQRDTQQSLTMITNLADTVKRLSSVLHGYLPSHDANIAAEALASDFAGRMCAASPMSVVDPPYAPRRLKAPLMAAMERHGLVMEPMMRLHGDGPCIPSPSVIASASQLMAVLQKTGKDITRIELLYKATVHGFKYTDMLNRVGDASCLLFLMRGRASIHGFFIDSSLVLPPQLAPQPRSNQYSAAVLVFKMSGPSQPTFKSQSLVSQYVTVSRAGSDSVVKLVVHPTPMIVSTYMREGLGLWASDSAASERCRVLLMGERGVDVVSMLVDEIEVLRLQAGVVNGAAG
ncbi:unnamed protein product [Vitrella brassicaformis CCMP3155]|uniref:TLDc domain-containing protein n=2 Tax=Vitrella brassicaformis TaxID=1169539 RepID=A0A0G4EXX2_VITBC|nr:unnamed protein product [Vitrella brassicaformis CCMP3155]|eukprot:CEM03464.1 unnamed protein product [Vitrella brassicaformis CCMP3155]